MGPRVERQEEEGEQQQRGQQRLALGRHDRGDVEEVRRVVDGILKEKRALEPDAKEMPEVDLGLMGLTAKPEAEVVRSEDALPAPVATLKPGRGKKEKGEAEGEAEGEGEEESHSPATTSNMSSSWICSTSRLSMPASAIAACARTIAILMMSAADP